MSQPTGAWGTAVAGLVQAAEQRLRKHIANTAVYAEISVQNPPSSETVSSANGHSPEQESARRYENEDPEQLRRRLEALLLRGACDLAESEAAELRAVSRIRRILLWSSLYTGLAVQGVLLAWLGWEIAQPVHYAHLVLPVVSNVLNGSTGAFAAHRLLRRKPKPLL